jgi:RNA polymerase sigma-32 factor
MIAQITSWSVAFGESCISPYLREVQRFPMLEPQDEYALAKRWGDRGDLDAAHCDAPIT